MVVLEMAPLVIFEVIVRQLNLRRLFYITKLIADSHAIYLRYG